MALATANPNRGVRRLNARQIAVLKFLVKKDEFTTAELVSENVIRRIEKVNPELGYGRALATLRQLVQRDLVSEKSKAINGRRLFTFKVKASGKKAIAKL